MLLAGLLSEMLMLSWLFLECLQPPVGGMVLATMESIIKREFFADMAMDETDLGNSLIVISLGCLFSRMTLNCVKLTTQTNQNAAVNFVLPMEKLRFRDVTCQKSCSC